MCLYESRCQVFHQICHSETAGAPGQGCCSMCRLLKDNSQSHKRPDPYLYTLIQPLHVKHSYMAVKSTDKVKKKLWCQPLCDHQMSLNSYDLVTVNMGIFHILARSHFISAVTLLIASLLGVIQVRVLSLIISNYYHYYS